MDLVSVIIPCYNVSSFVDKLSWIFEQTYPEIEIVLVDDCSSDDTWQKLQAFKQQYSDQRIIVARNETNLGPGPTRNYGLTLSTGKYVCFWDADDQVEPLFVEKMLQQLKQEQADFICCAYKESSAQKTNVVWINDNLLKAQQENNIDKLKSLVFDFSVGPWNKLVCRDFLFLNNIKFPAVFYGEDKCWTLQLVLNANKIAFINQVYYIYQVGINENSLTSVVNKRTLQSILEMADFNLSYIDKLGLSGQLRERCIFEFFSLILYMYETFVEKEQDRKMLITQIRDLCQKHKINTEVPVLSFLTKSYYYRFLPKTKLFINKREKMKIEYHWYSIRRKVSKILSSI